MNCPYCGSEVRENERFCQNCGAQLTQTAPAVPSPEQGETPDYQPTYAAAAAEAAPRPQNYKEFIKSPFCTPDVNRSIRTSWILLLICAALSFIVQLADSQFPIDAIAIAGVAIWLMLSKSFPAGVTAFVLGIIELVFTSISMGRLAGYFPAIAGVYALTAVLKARKQYKAYLQNVGAPTLR